MAAGVNKGILVGNTGKAPEMRYLQSGVAVCNVSLAVANPYASKENPETTWFKLIFWKEDAERFSDLVKDKGATLYVEGNIGFEAYINKDGDAAGTLTLTVRQWQVLKFPESQQDNRSQNSSGNKGKQQSKPQQQKEESYEFE